MTVKKNECPPWDYKRSQKFPALKDSCRTVLEDAASGKYSLSREGHDTRPIHLVMFGDLAPLSAPYYAGHYRGEEFECLRERIVGIPEDPTVGFPPHTVLAAIADLATSITKWSEEAKTRIEKGSVAGDRLLVTVAAVAAKVFERFLLIHPYLDGNGHIARFLVCLVMCEFGIRISRWPVEPRPSSPRYGDGIREAHRGINATLVRYIADCCDLAQPAVAS